MAVDPGPASVQMSAEDGDTVTANVTTALAGLQLPTERPDSPASLTLLQLPKELRLLIFDALFQPFVQEQPEDFDEYMLPSEWPKTHDFTAYTAISSTCKQLHFESKTHFETQFLPNTMMYFDNTPELWDFTEKISRFGPEYQDIVIQLSTCSHSAWFFTAQEVEEGPPNDVVGATFLAKLCINIQPDLDLRCSGVDWSLCNSEERHDVTHARTRLEYPGTQRLTSWVRQGKKIDILELCAPGCPLRVSTHQVCGHEHTQYSIMTARVGDLVWDWVDAWGVRELDLRKMRACCDKYLNASSLEIELAKLRSLEQ
ncbi:hypothetical protein LTR36_001284 [Oleoguttula mirabilis]|uniref:F-box domain-containing protein n=1 Tax=Oleoguttula mirabilis TaxID=1507867 RepID=A0AAV9JNC9_9PEZI|nr:hypothetical protein LTR36_001284 [Oleoguttula mirabilis]